MDNWIDVAAAADFRPGSRRKLDAGGTSMVIFNIAGKYYAIEDRCSHDDEALSNGRVKDCEITCPRHQARFSLITGAALSPPAYEAIATFPVRIADGRVQVRDDRFDS